MRLNFDIIVCHQSANFAAIGHGVFWQVRRAHVILVGTMLFTCHWMAQLWSRFT